MKDGIVRIGVATHAVKVANPKENGKELVRLAKRAAENRVKILVFPELSLTAYTAGDLFFQEALLSSAEEALAEYLEETRALDLLSVVGVPVAVGGGIYDCAAVAARGELLGLIPKTRLTPAERRVFAKGGRDASAIRYAGRETAIGGDQIFSCDTVKNLSVACEIGAEGFSQDAPARRLSKMGATLVLCPAAFYETVGAAEKRRISLLAKSGESLLAYALAGAGEGESGTDGVFSGCGAILSAGKLLAERKPFSEEELTFAEIDVDLLAAERRRTGFRTEKTPSRVKNFTLAVEETPLSAAPDPSPFVPKDGKEERFELILSIASRGLAGRIERSLSKKVVLGVSGGLDSTLALLISVRAMDLLKKRGKDFSRASVVSVTMPCFGTTKRTKGNAERLAESLGTELRVVDIKAAVAQHFKDIGHAANDYSVVYENAQARERTQVLMDIANGENALVVGTGDLSELALGWATYNGDHMSMYGVNGGIPKTLMRHLVAYAADEAEKAGEPAVAAVLRDVLATPVSPELLPPKDGEIAQCTEGLVGPYELHDFFLYYTFRFGFPPKKVLRLALWAFAGKYDEETVRGWLRVFVRRFFTQQFKRSCLPDGPKIGSIALSPRGALAMPSDADVSAFLSALDE